MKDLECQEVFCRQSSHGKYVNKWIRDVNETVFQKDSFDSREEDEWQRADSGVFTRHVCDFFSVQVFLENLPWHSVSEASPKSRGSLFFLITSNTTRSRHMDLLVQ